MEQTIDKFTCAEKYLSNVKNLVDNENNILELEECHICMVRGVNKLIECKTCHKCICTSCCNFMKSFKYDRELKNIDKCGVSALYNCPYCREYTETAFSKLNRDDLLEFIKIDYIKFIVIGNKYQKLEDKYQDLEMKIIKIDHLKKKEDDNEVIDFLIEENNRLKEIVDNIDNVIKNNDDNIRINRELHEEIYDLKHKHYKLIENNKLVVQENKDLTKYNDDIVKANNEMYNYINIFGNGHKDVIDNITNLLNNTVTPKKVIMKIKKYMTEELGIVSLKTVLFKKETI